MSAAGRGLVIAWLLTFALFATVPGIDLASSALFFDAEARQFPANSSGFLSVIREVIWTSSNLIALIALIFGAHALLSTRPTALPPRFWGFALLLILLGPVLLVNGILKEYWGRARPADVDVFGGAQPFTPAWEIAGNCASNCSFVSGEAAGVAVVAILLGIALWQSGLNRRRLLVALALLVILGAGLRLVKGRHFFSDISWSVLMMLTLAWALATWMRLAEVAHRITPAAFHADAKALWHSLKVSVGGSR